LNNIKLRLLPDNVPCYISKELKAYLDDIEMDHTHGKPYHPQTQWKLERYRRTMKNIVKLTNYYFPWELERELKQFVTIYNTERVNESIQNMTPADVFFGRDKEIQTARDIIKSMTLKNRKYINMGLDPSNQQPIRPADIRQSVF
jgi:putative transposase